LANENAPTSKDPIFWDVIHSKTEDKHFLTIRIFSLTQKNNVSVKYKFSKNSGGVDVTNVASVRVRTDPWVWFSCLEFPSGITEFEVSVLADGKDFWPPTKIPLGIAMTQTKGGAAAFAPRLSAAINSSDQTKPDEVTEISATYLNQLLKHIWSRLENPMDVAWLGPDGTKGLPDGSSMFIPNTSQQPEEAWAQAYTEMFFAIPYVSGGSFHLSDSAKDGDIFAKMQKEDPVHPLTAACQQLCSLAAITRGVKITGNGIDCALYRHPGRDAADPLSGSVLENPQQTVFTKKLGGKWLDADQKLLTISQINPPLKPGSMFMFAKEPGQTFAQPKIPGGSPPPIRSPGVPHIAFVIRVLPPGQVQFFDTGAIQPANRSQDDKLQFSHSHMLDYQPISSVSCTAGPFQGIGVLPEPTDLQESVKRMRTIRPLGCARLVIHRISDGQTLLMTPLLRMHSGELNFSIARYLWSLRDIPGPGLVRAEWWIYGSKGRLAKIELANNTRSLSLSKLFETYEEELKNEKQPFGDLVLASSNSDGKVSITGAFKLPKNEDVKKVYWAGTAFATNPVQNPLPAWGTFWLHADYEAQRADICDDLPGYYTNDWPTA
jgi:hypothetical protein